MVPPRARLLTSSLFEAPGEDGECKAAPFLASLGLTGCPEPGLGKHVLPFLAPQQTGVFCSCSNTNYTVSISSRAVVHLWIISSGHPCGSKSHLAGAELDVRRVHKYRIWSLYSSSLPGWRDNITNMPLKDNLVFCVCLPVNFGGTGTRNCKNCC